MIQPAAEAFFEACGAQRALPLEVAQRGRGLLVRHQLPLPFAVIGRDERADLRLNSKEVSHRHTYLQMLAGRWWWVDLDSRSGTHSENSSASPSHLLDHQGIRVGSYLIRLGSLTPLSDAPNGQSLQLAGGEAASVGQMGGLPDPLTADSDDPSLLPRVALEFHGSTEGTRTWKMDRALALFGRSPLCKVRLQSPMISRVHCAVINTALGLWVVDLLGREGTLINGQAVRWGLLDPEDEMQIDQFRIYVRYLSPASRSALTVHGIATAEEDLELSPRRNAIGATQGRSLTVAGTDWEQEKEQANPLAPLIAPVGSGVPMTGAEALLMPLVKQFNQMQQQMFDQFQHTLLMMAQMFGNVQREQMALIRQELEQIQELTRQLHELSSEGGHAAPSPLPALPQAPAAEIPPPPNRRTKTAAAPARPDPPPPSKFAASDVHAWLTQRLAALQEERQTRWQKVLNLITGK